MAIAVRGFGVGEDDQPFEPPDGPILLLLELRQPGRLRRCLALRLLNGKPKCLGVLLTEPSSVCLRRRKRPAVDPREEPLVLVGLRR